MGYLWCHEPYCSGAASYFGGIDGDGSWYCTRHARRQMTTLLVRQLAAMEDRLHDDQLLDELLGR